MSGRSILLTRLLAGAGLLLAVPATLAIGWGIGQLPTPQRNPDAVVARAGDPAITTPSLPGRAGPAIADDAHAGAPAIDAPDAAGPPATQAPESSEPAPPSELSQWTTLERAISESQRNGKPVMIDFNADWCPPCRRMKEEVFQNGAHAWTVQTTVIPVSIVDRSREEGRNPPDLEDLQRRYDVDAFPTLIVFSPANGRVIRTKGYGGAESTVAWIMQAAQSVR